MSIHTYLSNIFFKFLDNVYYKNLKSIYNKDLSLILHFPNKAIIKPEYFIYGNYYFIYSFFQNITNKNIIMYSIFLHIQYINELLFDNIIINYNYTPENDIIFLKKTSNMLFHYLFFFKIVFLNISISNKIYIIFLQSLFYLLYQIHNIYKERLLCIENKIVNKNIDKNILKLLIISPDKEIIQKITYSTRFANYSNYLFFINIVLYLFL